MQIKAKFNRDFDTYRFSNPSALSLARTLQVPLFSPVMFTFPSDA